MTLNGNPLFTGLSFSPGPVKQIHVHYTMFPGSAPWHFLDFSEAAPVARAQRGRAERSERSEAGHLGGMI